MAWARQVVLLRVPGDTVKRSSDDIHEEVLSELLTPEHTAKINVNYLLTVIQLSSSQLNNVKCLCGQMIDS